MIIQNLSMLPMFHPMISEGFYNSRCLEHQYLKFLKAIVQSINIFSHVHVSFTLTLNFIQWKSFNRKFMSKSEEKENTNYHVPSFYLIIFICFDLQCYFIHEQATVILWTSVLILWVQFFFPMFLRIKDAQKTVLLCIYNLKLNLSLAIEI